MKIALLSLIGALGLVVNFANTRAEAPAAPAASAPTAEEQLKLHQGSWQLTYLEGSGNKVDPAQFQDLRRVVVNDTGTWKRGEQVLLQTRIKLDPAHDPAWIDVTMQSGNQQGQIMLGIYKFEDDLLKIAVAAVGQPRPTEFATQPGTGSLLLHMKKAD